MALKAKAMNYATNCNLPTAHRHYNKTHREHTVYTSCAGGKNVNLQKL